MPKKQQNRTTPKRLHPLKGLPDSALLKKRICDLDVRLESSWVEPMIGRLYDELGSRNLRIKPHCWLSDEWFSPDGIPGIAIPFYLVHPRLLRLEKKQMFEVEGGTQAWCMRILRHEAGHAIDTAFRIHRRKSYRETFGDYHAPYPKYYRPRPHSKNYVHHLEPWYSQSHPAEDFAETFAVWLNDRSAWRKKYAGWRAFKKLQYVDRVMKQISGRTPKVRSRAKVDPAHRNTMTLDDFYQQRHERYGFDCPATFKTELKKLFRQRPKNGTIGPADKFLTRNRREICRAVATWTGEYRYNINLIMRAMIEHCREMELMTHGNPAQLKSQATLMLAVQTMTWLRSGQHRVAV